MSDDGQLRFLERALDESGQWTRFADPKALAALAIMGLVLANLLEQARPMIDAHDDATAIGWATTLAFWAAVGCAALTIVNVVRSLWPRVEVARPATRTLYFFGDVASFESAAAYEREVRERSDDELVSAVAAQVWAVSQIAAIKHRHVGAALRWVVAFLVCWAVARLGLVVNPA